MDRGCLFFYKHFFVIGNKSSYDFFLINCGACENKYSWTCCLRHA